MSVKSCRRHTWASFHTHLSKFACCQGLMARNHCRSKRNTITEWKAPPVAARHSRDRWSELWHVCWHTHSPQQRDTMSQHKHLLPREKRWLTACSIFNVQFFVCQESFPLETGYSRRKRRRDKKDITREAEGKGKDCLGAKTNRKLSNGSVINSA